MKKHFYIDLGKRSALRVRSRSRSAPEEERKVGSATGAIPFVQVF